MKLKIVKILTCSLILILFLTIKGSSSEYLELVLDVGNKYEFRITELETLLEINGTDYMNIDMELELLGMFGITNTSIEQGDTFEIILKSIQEQNETDFISSMIGPVYEVNVSQTIGNDTNKLMTTTDCWVLHYIVLGLVTSLGFDISTPESIDFSEPEPASSSGEAIGPPVFMGTNLTFYEMLQNQSRDVNPTMNTTIEDNITSTWETIYGAEIIGDIFSLFYHYNGTKVLNSTDIVWTHVVIGEMILSADLSRNIVTSFNYFLFSNTTLDNANRVAKTVYGFEEPSDEPEISVTPTITPTTHPTTHVPTTTIPTTTPFTTPIEISSTIPSQESTHDTEKTTATSRTIPEASPFLNFFPAIIIFSTLVIFIRKYKKM
ncbi:MAG: hypothetical protein ACFFB2_17450 [Promethearchaeota archaeon]